MRINFACASPTVHITRFFCIVVKERTAAWSASRSQCRMEAPERARSMAARAARPTSFCLAAEPLYGTPGAGGGAFCFQIFLQASSPEMWSATISGGEEVLAAKWGGLFWATYLEKIIGGVIAIISFRSTVTAKPR